MLSWVRRLSGLPLLRRLATEVALCHGEAVAPIYLDMAKFYDRNSWDLLARRALDLGLPTTICSIGLQVHSGPRLIRLQTGRVSGPIAVDTSIVAGDGQRNSWARCTLDFFLEEVHKFALEHLVHPWSTAEVREFVDDIPCTLR